MDNLRRSAIWQIEIGMMALILGIVLYVFDRPPSQIYFIPELVSQYKGETFIFGFIGYHLPTQLLLMFCS